MEKNEFRIAVVNGKVYAASQRGCVISTDVELFSFGAGHWEVKDIPEGDKANSFSVNWTQDKDLVVMEGDGYPQPLLAELGSVVRKNLANGVRLTVCRHEMDQLPGGDLRFRRSGPLLFLLDQKTDKPVKKDKPVKPENFAARLPVPSILGSKALNVLFRAKLFPKKDKFELAPVRPVVYLRGPVHLNAMQAVRLV